MAVKTFSVGSEDDLKMVLYGIEQRFYTIPIGGEKRIANSVLAVCGSFFRVNFKRDENVTSLKLSNLPNVDATVVSNSFTYTYDCGSRNFVRLLGISFNPPLNTCHMSNKNKIQLDV